MLLTISKNDVKERNRSLNGINVEHALKGHSVEFRNSTPLLIPPLSLSAPREIIFRTFQSRQPPFLPYRTPPFSQDQPQRSSQHILEAQQTSLSSSTSIGYFWSVVPRKFQSRKPEQVGSRGRAHRRAQERQAQETRLEATFVFDNQRPPHPSWSKGQHFSVRGSRDHPLRRMHYSWGWRGKCCPKFNSVAHEGGSVRDLPSVGLRILVLVSLFLLLLFYAPPSLPAFFLPLFLPPLVPLLLWVLLD